jgi:SnoaL-like domain
MFVDNSVGMTYRGRALADPVRNYGTAFSNMHRELHRIYVDGNVVVVQLALQGTHDGPLQLPFGDLPATGKQMDAPCCDVFSSKTVRSSASTATQRGRSSLLNSGS